MNNSTECVPQTALCSTCQNDLSEWCLPDHPSYSDIIPEECFPLKERSFTKFVGLWCIINCIAGSMGNLLTILAVPYAIKRKKFGFHTDSTHKFIVNLAVCDFLYCITNLPLYAVQYLHESWPYSATFCSISTCWRYINAFAEWMSLAFIALSRCVNLKFPLRWGNRLFRGKGGIFTITLIWLYAIILQMPLMSGLLGTYGYNCQHGKCDMIPLEETSISIDPSTILYGIAFLMPCIIIFVSYSLILQEVKRSTRNVISVINTASSEFHQRNNERDRRLTKAVLMICALYILFVMPISVCNMLDECRADVELALFCVYWMQYTLNFVVYGARNGLYRKAYKHYLKQKYAILRSCFKPLFSRPLPGRNTTVFTINVVSDGEHVCNTVTVSTHDNGRNNYYFFGLSDIILDPRRLGQQQETKKPQRSHSI